MFNIKSYLTQAEPHVRYQKRIAELRAQNKYTKSIEIAVNGAIENLTQNKSRSFVVYGEPQSGKTEMMIALTARLLDEGFRIVILLLNDSVQLLNQNLDRFRRSGLNPSPKNFAEILDPSIKIGENEWVIFCKKNPKDLKKLIEKLHGTDEKIIVDDEADYATPNSKVNKGEKTKINELIESLLGKEGKYIGVTATPARLDLNNTFENENDRWVDFPPHPDYKGQNVFFPTNLQDSFNREFTLTLLPEVGDDPKYLREALFRFFVNVAFLNLKINQPEKNYSILIHTSGKRADHSQDYVTVQKTLAVLNNLDDPNCNKYFEQIFEFAKKRYAGSEEDIIRYILNNRNRSTIVVMNSDVDKKNVDYTNATSPCAIFTIAIGGNIVSRGVTFDNLLSMFFTRDVKHKIQQDTYIQRARMFGSRGSYLKYFELSIPENLYLDWHKCFIFHRLSLQSIRSGNGSPVWLENARISAVSNSSIDRTTVVMSSGEMSFDIFDHTPQVETIINSNISSFAKLKQLCMTLGNLRMPDYLIAFIENFSPMADKSLAIHHTSSIVNMKDKDTNQEKIQRSKGFMGTSSLQKSEYPDAIHHLKIFTNADGKARLFYKYDGNIKFLKNQK